MVENLTNHKNMNHI